MCPQQYYLEYLIGMKGPGNKAADIGSIVHKVLEILAKIKKAQQNGKDKIEDEITEESTTDFNIQYIIEKVYLYYTKVFNQVWTDDDFKIVTKHVYNAIEYGGGMFNPLNRIIVEPEQQFNFSIEKEWAKYDFTDPVSGEQVQGYLGLKGTIDLLTQIDDKTYEIVDWKTGARKNWATGEEKTQAKLEHDPQLLIYFYAASHLYPNIEQIVVTIFFIKDGGPFTVVFTKDNMRETEQMLKERFDTIRKTEKPKLNKSWKCTKFCHFGKNTFEGTHKKPIVEFRNGEVTKRGQLMTICEQIKFETDRKGLDKVTKEYIKPGHSISHYQAPGGTQ